MLGQLTDLAKRTAPDDFSWSSLLRTDCRIRAETSIFSLTTRIPKQLVATGLPQRDLEYALSKAPAKRLALLVAPAIRAALGFAISVRVDGDSSSERRNRLLASLGASKPGIAVVTAATASESSLEDARWGGGHGVFTHHLLRGLSGDGDVDDDKNGLVTVRELFDFVYREVSGDTRGQQHPELKGTFDNAMPLAQPVRAR